ncbi:MAG TPA: RidA family protein [Acetobacteraceae bacterium]|jgi:enamine deaminase RidA (YjgF/YER057c/UK114 family)|nr:RidA family protein [Acetobacteraceae bacterium]
MAVTPILPVPARDAALAYNPGMLVSDARRTLYISGQVATDAEGKVSPDFEAQARQVWRNIEAVLAGAHMTFRDIVKLTTFLLDSGDLEINGRVRAEVLQGHKPASTLVYVSGLVRPEWRLEIEAVAVAAT